MKNISINGHCEESRSLGRRSNLLLVFRLLRPDFIGTRNDNQYSFTPLLSLIILTMLFSSCGPQKIEPVELFPEDECASCRMTVSGAQFASEIINNDGTVVKFDDLKCFENYRKTHDVVAFAAIFVKNYDTKEWIPFGKSIVIQTGIDTPMGSGQVAVADQQRAMQLKEQYPVTIAVMDGDACCPPKKK